MNIQDLCKYMEASMSPVTELRKPAENYLLNIERNPGYSRYLFQILTDNNRNNNISFEIKTASAIAFKNFIKRNWLVDESNDDKINKEERDFIKLNIIDIMLNSPSIIQNQLSEAVSIIGKNDFPDQWPSLLPQLIEKINKGDFTIINAVLRTCHSLFKRYRSEGRSDSLWLAIKEVISKLAVPLTQLIEHTMSLIEQHSSDKQAVSVLWSSVLLICKIFFSLNYQDLPEYFEDNIVVWMTQFHRILTTVDNSYNNNAAANNDDEASILEEVKSEVCNILSLYASKYDEEFAPNFLSTFIADVYNVMLTMTTTAPRYDSLVSAALNFLCIVVNKAQHCAVFNSIVNLEQLCRQIIVPNIEIQQSDLELFEDNYDEYIRRDIEGSNALTRRKSSCELVRSLNRYQGNQVVTYFGQHIEQLLAQYAMNPAVNWRSKDSALFLVTSLASQGETERSGVTSASELVDVKSFYQSHILPELQNHQGNVVAVVKADCIKYVMAFRTLLSPDDLRIAVNLMINFLSSESHVVHSYAAAAINKLLMVKDGSSNDPVITGQHINNPTRFITLLCSTMSIKGSEDNIYAMQAIMRSLSSLQSLALDSMNHLVGYLRDKLALVVKNPKKPIFNHSLIEAIALCIKIVCKENKDFVNHFESLLCPIFNDVLVGDIEEFIPYTFQLFSLMLDQHPPQTVTDAYVQLFPFLVHPALWERSGNIPSLIRLLLSYLEKANGSIIVDKLDDLVNIFQRLNNSRALDTFGFSLITAVMLYVPRQQTEKHIKTVFISIFQRLSKNKTTKYLRGFLLFFSSLIFVYSANEIIQLINSIQANLFQMTLDSAIVPTITNITERVEKKIVTIGMIKLMTEGQEMIGGNYSRYWTTIASKVVESLSNYDPNADKEKEAHFVDINDSRSNTTNLNQLLFVGKKTVDPSVAIGDPRIYLGESLKQMSIADAQRFSALYSSLDNAVVQAMKLQLSAVGVNI